MYDMGCREESADDRDEMDFGIATVSKFKEINNVCCRSRTGVITTFVFYLSSNRGVDNNKNEITGPKIILSG
jgi:hypothetical protein